MNSFQDPSNLLNQNIHRKSAVTLLLLVSTLLVYASFYPLEFDWNRLRMVFRGPVSGWMPWRRTGEADMIVNLLGYLPIGFFAALAMPGDWPGWKRITTALLGCGLLSLSIELAQNATRIRNPNQVDLILNTLSGGVGALVGIGFGHRSLVFVSSLLRLRHLSPVVAILLLLWTILHAAPFMPSIGLYKFHVATQSIRDLSWTFGATARWFAAWTIAAELVRAATRRELFWRTFAGFSALSLLFRVSMLRQRLALDEVLGLALVALAVYIVRSRPHVTLAGAMLGILIAGLAPFQFNTLDNPQHFTWIPFGGILESQRETYLVFVEKAFLYTGLVWLGVRSGLPATRSGSILAFILAAIECAQRFLPERTAEITDPLMAVLAAILLGVLGEETVSPANSSSAHV